MRPGSPPRVRNTELGIFFLLLFSTAYFHHAVEYDNTMSRYYLLSAVVDLGRLDIDPYADRTIDVSVAGGHTYSNKAIGAPLLAVPVYWALRNLTPLAADEPLSPRTQYLTRVLTTSVPFALLGVVLFRVMLRLGARPRAAYFAVLAYAFGTIAWVNAMLFGGHQLAASLAFFSFASVLFLGDRPGGGSPLLWLGAGLLAGLAALADFTVIYIAAVLALYAIWKAQAASQRLAFLVGGGLMATLLAAYNAWCFGSPFSLSYAHLGHEDFAAGSEQGILGVGLPDLDVLVSLLISPSRGLCFVMPVLLLAGPGLWRWLRRRESDAGEARTQRWRPEAITVIAIVAGMLLINAGFYGWHGGWTFGPRYLVPMLPFLVLPVAFAVDRIGFPLLFALSVLQVGCAAMLVPHTPEPFQNPIVECILPLFREGYLARNLGQLLGLPGVLSLLPWLGGSVLLAWLAVPRGDDTPLPTSRGLSLACGVVALGVSAGLMFVRTPPDVDLHIYRSRLLGNAGFALSSNDLVEAALREYQLSPTLNPPRRR